MKKCKSEDLSSAERHLEESLRPKDTKRTPRPTRKQRVEKREREARERAGEGLNQHD